MFSTEYSYLSRVSFNKPTKTVAGSLKTVVCGNRRSCGKKTKRTECQTRKGGKKYSKRLNVRVGQDVQCVNDIYRSVMSKRNSL